MGKLELLFHKLKWNSIRNLFSRLYWRFRSYYYIEMKAFIKEWYMNMWDIGKWQITFKTGMPWGRYHEDTPWQIMGDDAVTFYNWKDLGRIDLRIIPNSDVIYHKGHNEVPELSVGSIFSEQEFLYGEFELECTLPDKGQWPAFWLLGDHGWPPEIDIFEFFPKELNITDKNRKLSTTIHYKENDIKIMNGSSIRIPNQEGRSKFGLRWLPSSLEFFYNGKSYLKLNDSELIRKHFDKPMRIIIGTGVSGYDYNDNVFNSIFRVHNVTYKAL